MPHSNTTLSHRFITALDSQRDRLWALAGASVPAVESQATGTATQTVLTTGKAEAALHAAIREAFGVVEKDHDLDPLQAMEGALVVKGGPGGGTVNAAESPSPQEDAAASAMPADVWARLVATVQVEAARSAHTRAINPDSVLLSPDPLLAPRKTALPDDADGFDLSPSSRFMLAAAIAVLVGIGLTIYLLTRPGTGGPDTQPAASSQAASVPAATLPAPPVPPTPTAPAR